MRLWLRARVADDYEFICTQTSSSHDYEAHNAAAATSAQSCSTTSAQCFPAGFACTGDYTGSPLTWSYPAVRVAVGHDVYGGVSDTSYVFPAEAYTWKVRALHEHARAPCTTRADAAERSHARAAGRHLRLAREKYCSQRACACEERKDWLTPTVPSPRAFVPHSSRECDAARACGR